MKGKLLLIGILTLGLLVIDSQKVHAQTPDLSATEVASNNIIVPESVNSMLGTVIQNGYKGWFSLLENNSQETLTNATIRITSGYDASYFSGIPFPFTQPIGDVAPGDNLFLNPLSPSPELPIPTSYTLGFDSSRTATPTTIPNGGTQQTITITLTPTDVRYAQNATYSITINATQMGSPLPQVSLVSMTDPTNLDQGEEVIRLNDYHWQLSHAQLNKTYTFTAVIDVANSLGVPFTYQPSIQIDGQTNETVCDSCTGSAVAIPDPSLDGTLPGSGGITFAIDQASHIWSTNYSTIYDITYDNSLPKIPTTKDECKKGGWKNFTNPSFKNQGDCVSFVSTHGKNPPSGN